MGRRDGTWACRLALAAGLALCGPGTAATITPVAESTAGYSSFDAPSVNSSGTVAFTAATGGTFKVFTAAPGAGATLALDPATASLTGARNAVINDAGQVGFISNSTAPSLPSGYRLDPGHQVTTVFNATSLNDVVQSVTTAGPGGTLYFDVANNGIVQGGAVRGDGSTTTTLIPANGGVGPHNVSRLAASSSQGHWAASVAPTNISTFRQVWEDGNVILTDTDRVYTDPFFGTSTLAAFGDPDVNSAGTVLVSANFAGAYDGIWKLDQGTVTPVLKSGAGVPAINDHNVMAALLTAGTKHIVYGNGDLSHTLISVGDALDGSTVTDLSFIHDGLSDGGADTLAFEATLADGRSGIFTAQVPEPAALALLASVAAPACVGRRRRKQR